MVTVAIYGWESENERDACIEHVRKQTLADIEILTQGEVDNSISFRNRAVAEAKGEYIAFLHAKARYVFPNALQLMMLTAQAEDAEMVVGKCDVKDGAKTLYPDGLPWNVEAAVSSDTYQNQFNGDLGALSSCLLNVSFLRKNGLDFEDGGPFAEERLIRKSAALAGMVFELGRSFTWRNSACSCDFTKTETNRARIGFYLSLLRFAAERDLPKFRDFVSTEIFESPHTVELRDYYWSLRESDEKSAVRAEIESLAALADRAKVEETFLNPLVSVIVPVYNTEKYINRCIGSILNQTEKSFELICVDDGSQDDSLAILRDWAKCDARIRVFHQENAGQSSARNFALKVSSGKYICFVDSDDYISSELLHKASSIMECDGEIDYVKFAIKAEYNYEVSEKERIGLENYYRLPIGPGKYNADCRVLSTGTPCNKFYRASLIKDNGIQFPVGVKFEDEAFCFFTNVRARYMQVIPDQLYFYERNQDGTLARATLAAAKGILPDNFSVYNLILQFLERECAYPYFGELFKRIVSAVSNYGQGSCEDLCLACAQDLLKRGRFFERVDFGWRKVGWVKTYGAEILCRTPTAGAHFKDLTSFLPISRDLHIDSVHDRPVISFIIPVFNQEEYLSRCLESIRAQTISKIEIVCINDGSTDDSARILAEYQKIDKRIRVVSKDNSGVSDSRNRGLDIARGEYVAFVDADDWVERNYVEKTVLKARAFHLDLISFDFRCFDYRTGNALAHWWNWSNLKRHCGLEFNKLISLGDMPNFYVYGSCWQFVFQRDFLIGNGLKFVSGMKLSEDLMFVVSAFAVVKRFMIVEDVLYHYRRGNPSSAISRMSFTVRRGSSSAVDVQVETVRHLIEDILTERVGKLPVMDQAKLLWRVFHDSLMFAEKSVDCTNALVDAMAAIPKILKDQLNKMDPVRWKKFEKMSSCRNTAPQYSNPADWASSWMPTSAVKSLREIKKRRAEIRNKDLIIVVSFLSGRPEDDTECVDSWTFFRYLQERGVPSCYVTNAHNSFYRREVEKSKFSKNVISLSGGGLADYEILSKCSAVLCRAKAMVMEDIILPEGVIFHLREWDDLALILLQHGIVFTPSKVLRQHLPRFNYINVSSQWEADFVCDMLSPIQYASDLPTCIMAGLPRFDLLSSALRQKNVKESRTVLLMPTWRQSFTTEATLVRSMYYNRVVSFLRSPKVARLREQGVRLVYAPHHAISKLLKNKLDLPVEICQANEVSRLIREADCLITDFSSVTFDFLFQDKPVIFWAIDDGDRTLELDDQEKVLQGKLAVEDIGKCAKTADEVLDLIENCIRHDFEIDEIEKKNATKFFQCRSGICRRLYDEIVRVTAAK